MKSPLRTSSGMSPGYGVATGSNTEVPPIAAPTRPRSSRPGGRRTRDALLRAARGVFERDGFVNARISDISKSAGVAHGTFYTHFPSKEAVFRELVVELQAQLSRPSEQLHRGDGRAPVDRIKESNRTYLEGYRRNAGLMATLEQVTTLNNEMREFRRSARNKFVERNARSIRQWQKAGIADPNLDPIVAAGALGSMVDRFAYVWLVVGEDYDFDVAVDTLTRLWCQALGMSADPPDASGPVA